MVTWRPVDELPKPEGFRFTRQEALRLGCCCRCGMDQDPDRLRAMDEWREYQISALCPLCSDELMALWPEECE